PGPQIPPEPTDAGTSPIAAFAGHHRTPRHTSARLVVLFSTRVPAHRRGGSPSPGQTPRHWGLPTDPVVRACAVLRQSSWWWSPPLGPSHPQGRSCGSHTLVRPHPNRHFDLFHRNFRQFERKSICPKLLRTRFVGKSCDIHGGRGSSQGGVTDLHREMHT